MDIEPPEDTGSGDQLSGAQLEQLGLPAQHVHYTAAAAARGNTAELLQPADIQVSYADTAGNTAGDIAGNTAGDTAGNTAGNSARVWGGWEGADTVAVPQLEAEVEPPRALPDTAPAPAPGSLVDNIYTLAAYCGLDCGPGVCREVDIYISTHIYIIISTMSTCYLTPDRARHQAVSLSCRTGRGSL